MGKVLVVDDEQTTARLEAMYLTEAGHKVHIAATEQQAVDWLKMDRPDLMVLDAHLPGEGGLRLLRFGLDRPAPVPALVVACQGAERLAEKFLQAGARGCLFKSSVFYRQLVESAFQALGAAAPGHRTFRPATRPSGLPPLPGPPA